jgi:hypothetical protein
VQNKKIEPPVFIGKELKAIAVADNDLMVQVRDNSPVRLGSFLAHTHGGDGWDLDTELIAKLLADDAVDSGNDQN